MFVGLIHKPLFHKYFFSLFIFHNNYTAVHRSPKELHFRGYLLPSGVHTIVHSGKKIMIQAIIVNVIY
jgi:hypothetical protein